MDGSGKFSVDWRIQNFTFGPAGYCIASKNFSIPYLNCNDTWKLQLFPNGNFSKRGKVIFCLVRYGTNCIEFQIEIQIICGSKNYINNFESVIFIEHGCYVREMMSVEELASMTANKDDCILVKCTVTENEGFVSYREHCYLHTKLNLLHIRTKLNVKYSNTIVWCETLVKHRRDFTQAITFYCNSHHIRIDMELIPFVDCAICTVLLQIELKASNKKYIVNKSILLAMNKEPVTYTFHQFVTTAFIEENENYFLKYGSLLFMCTIRAFYGLQTQTRQIRNQDNSVNIS